MNKKNLLLFIIPLLFACEKTSIHFESVDKLPHWSFDKYEVSIGNSFTNSAANEDLFVCTGPDIFFRETAAGKDDAYLINLSKNLDYQFPITGNYSINIFPFTNEDGFVQFFSSYSPFIAGDKIWISELDPDYEHFELITADKGCVMPINQKDQILIPYKTNNGTLKFQLISLTTNVTNDYPFYDSTLDVTETKTISLGSSGENSISYMNTSGDYFYVSMQNKSFRIDPEGRIEMVFDGLITDIIQTDEQQIAMAYKNGSYSFVSNNNGIDWIPNKSIPWYYTEFQYTVINNRIVAYKDDQIHELHYNNEELSLSAIENNGLEGLKISSITPFQNKVMLSTHNGIYSVEKDLFFTEKEEE